MSKTSFLCVFFFYLATILISVACLNNETDFRALIAFKNGIENYTHGALNWNETRHFCSWQGVFCSHSHKNRVVAIELTSQGLVGTISPHLGNLSFLKYINLQNNTFYGQIPNEIGRLKRLEQADFSYNSLSGEIPKNISRCQNINYLNLIDNKLSGIIPMELSSLMKLERLGLSSNQLSGTIPSFIGNFTSLKALAIVECGMQGEIPESLVHLKSLVDLYLTANNLTGSIPRGLFNISTMSVFHAALNQLEGTIPVDVGSTFSSLTQLYLWGNLFTGEIPASMSNISSLEDLRLQTNSFIGRVNIDFNRLPALTDLGLSENLLEGDLNFISSMINCTQLTIIALASNQLSGSLPDSIANLSRQLTWLAISNNHLYGKIPPGIGNLPSFTGINLSENDLDGPIPSEMGKFKNLQTLNLGGNKFSTEIPSSFGNLTSLIYLDLDRNNLSGNVPQSLGNCTNLLQFNVSYNSLNGPIPPHISRLTSSYAFDLSYNVLTGSIPVEVGSLINLELLDLSYNRLSGYVPSSLGGCTTLEVIFLQSNSFSGEIPNDLRSMRSLQHMDLSQNNLSGPIPTFLGELNLSYLNLSFNRLEGRIPSQGVFLNENSLSLEGNNDLCGGIPSLNFTPCSLENSKKKKHFPIIFKVLIPVISVGAIALACYYLFICMQGKSKHAHTSSLLISEDGYLRLSYADLRKFTDEFSESNLLGAGRFGSVYKGILHDSQTSVAVKVLHLNVKGASKSFMSECNILRTIRHRNLVKILSVCSSIDFQKNDFKALVYEFMANGNLDEWLHKKPGEGSVALSLRQRLYIAIDIASALEYLHFGTDSAIVHGDLKPSNVLLDEEMNARVGDFGLAKVVSHIFSTNNSSSVGIRGTIGYIAPEYGIGGMVSTQGDVYSYGILLLEMFTGKRPTDDDFKDSWSLPDFVRTAFPKQVMDVLDPAIRQEFNHGMNVKLMDSVTLILETGLACSVELPVDRITMTDVVNRLKKASQLA